MFKMLPYWGGFEIRNLELFKDFQVGGNTYRVGLRPDSYPFFAYAPVVDGIPQYNQALFYVDKNGKLVAQNAEISGKLIAGAGSSIDWSYIKNVQVQNAQIVSLDAGKITTGYLSAARLDATVAYIRSSAQIANAVIQNAHIQDLAVNDAKISNVSASKLTAGTIDASIINVINLNASNITTGTLTGRTVQTAASGKRIVLETTGDNANEIIIYGSDGYPKLSIYENLIAWETNPWIISPSTDTLEIRFPVPIADIRSFFFTRGTRADVKIYGSPSKDIEVPNLIPSGSNNLGSFYYKWQHLYLSGNIYIDGTVDGVDISAHAANPSAHHTKTAYSSEITVNSNWQMNNYEINNLSYLRFSSTYGRIYWGADLVLDIYPDRIEFGKHLVPKNLALNLNLGSASLYWNEINYKYLTDRGCLGIFDKGVELNDGRIVSDTEALQAIKKRRKKTAYGVPMMDYKTLPKAVYKPAKTKKEVEGAEMGALISIMIGAIRELDKRLKKLENQKK